MDRRKVFDNFDSEIKQTQNPTNMKLIKPLFSTLTLLVVFSTGVFAQGEASITASANVVTDVTLTAEQNLDFGSLTDSDAEAGKTITLGTADSLGTFKMTSLSTSDDVIFVITAPDNLSPSDAPEFQGITQDDLPLDLTATYSENENTPGGGTDDFSFTNNNGELSKAPTAAEAFVYVGGTIGGSAGTYQGQYTGDITLSVYYD